MQSVRHDDIVVDQGHNAPTMLVIGAALLICMGRKAKLFIHLHTATMRKVMLSKISKIQKQTTKL